MSEDYLNYSYFKILCKGKSHGMAKVTRLGNLLDFGQLFKATINLFKSPTFLGNFCKGVKIYHFYSEIILGNFYRHYEIFSGHTAPAWKCNERTGSLSSRRCRRTDCQWEGVPPTTAPSLTTPTMDRGPILYNILALIYPSSKFFRHSDWIIKFLLTKQKA